MTLYQCTDSYGSPHFFGAMPSAPLPEGWTTPVPVHIEQDAWCLSGFINQQIIKAENNTWERTK